VRKRKILVWLVIAGTAAAAAYWLPGLPIAPLAGGPASQAKGERRVENIPADSRFASLPKRELIGERHGDPFAGYSPPRVVAKAAAAAVPVKPLPPTMPYRAAGKILQDGVEVVMLAKGDRMLPVQVGETLEDGYRLESIGADEIVLLYVPLGLRERLPMLLTLDFEPPAVSAAASAPAKSAASAPAKSAASAPAKSEPEPRAAELRWEGPDKVQAGSTFTVTLKLTSSEPLRASPLQVAFDAKLLEPVGVKPGKFFNGDGSFSFRVNPEGHIFVGASGPGNIPSDAELVVLSFKPLRPAASAEVRLSSVFLQGKVGKSIPVGQLTAYRTSITP